MIPEVFEESGRDDLGAGLEQAAPFGPFLAHAATEDDEVRREVELDTRQVLVELLGPCLPAQLAALPRRSADERLGVAAMELQVAELGVGHQVSIDEQGAADAGTQRQQQDRAHAAAGGAKGQLRHARRIRVIDDEHGSPDGRPDVVRRRPADPARIDVRGTRQASVLDDPRQSASNGQDAGRVVAQQHLGDHGRDGRADCLGGGWLGCPLPDPGADERGSAQVDEGRLDTRPADVDTQSDAGQSSARCRHDRIAARIRLRVDLDRPDRLHLMLVAHARQDTTTGAVHGLPVRATSRRPVPESARYVPPRVNRSRPT